MRPGLTSENSTDESGDGIDGSTQDEAQKAK